MPTGLLVPNDEPDPAAFAARAADHGYDSVWVNELWTRDAFVTLTRIAERTERIDLGTAIVNTYSRSPATLAQAIASVDRVAAGDVVLGLGPSTRRAIEDLHGMDFETPARRLHETIELTREFLHGGGRVDYDGDCFDVQDFPSLGSTVDVYAAALGPATRRATGRTADGWLPHNIPFSRLAEAFETIAETARERERDPDDITTTLYLPAAVAEDGDDAREAMRGHIAYYIGSGEGYRRAVASEYETAEDVAAAWAEGEREDARELVTDEMVSDLGVAGTPAEARAQLREVVGMDVVDEVLVVLPNGVSGEMKTETVAALAGVEG